eukprot:TRINITY_DN4767_c0_g1_i1.p1 TRINITY_DN4767_c0_g1~~TRINITY_DN4767_c0_g1_i1.p1  ORF type:complete len:286 (-),score=108.32 TRINITY_DN4767_c0_g1_i1:116-973(-)
MCIRDSTSFIPSANEWLHEFSWHGNDPTDKGRLVKGALTFTKLRTVPAQLYYNVSDVRTQDDAMLRIKLMMFYHITDVPTMLDSTSDPIGDFSNAVCADVIRLVSEHTFESFLQQTSALNELHSYPVLQQRAQAVGFVIDKVVFRGYKASEHLQHVYDDAIQYRAKMRLEAEANQQREAAEDLKLSKRMERAQHEREIQLAEQNHKLEIAELEHQHTLRVEKERSDVQAEAKRVAMVEELEYLDHIEALQAVDLTKVIVSRNQKDAHVLRVEDASCTPHLHLDAN